MKFSDSDDSPWFSFGDDSGGNISTGDDAFDEPPILLTPEWATVKPRETLQFRVKLHGKNDSRVRWSIAETNGGTISSMGLYTAPDTVGTVTVIATSKADPSLIAMANIQVEDYTPPNTLIASGPVASTSATEATFVFNGSDDVAVDHLECMLDGGTWEPCTSPASYSGLMTSAAHQFAVRAVDLVGNVDLSPATWGWLIGSLRASQISVGTSQSCALVTTGGIVCWGGNQFGELGDWTSVGQPTPISIFGLGTTMAAVAAGDHFTCALSQSGGVKCWGDNWYGKLGRGNAVAPASVPFDVSGLTSGVASIASGNVLACARETAGGVKCWGRLYDSLGNVTNRNVPVPVTGATADVAAITVGGAHACALTTAGGVSCWGNNYYGQLGNGTTASRGDAVAVTGLSSGVAAISAGESHTCAVTTGGAVKCWGHGGFSQLGTADGSSSSVPIGISGLSSGVASIEAGKYHTCVVTTGGGIKCWGGNDDGVLGDATTLSKKTPVPVVSLSTGMAAVSAGGDHTCAITDAGRVKCWGFSMNGQLGFSPNINSRSPAVVEGWGAGVSSVTSGYEHTCALLIGGTVQCLGWNNWEQLGNGTTAASATPVAVLGLPSPVAALSAGSAHTCALEASGGVRCWGENVVGQLGDGTTTGRSTAVPVTGLPSGVIGVVSGGYHTCVLTSVGGIFCWGNNLYGQLGDGSTTTRTQPVAVTGLGSGVAAIATSTDHTCALTTTGTVKCWGWNINGQLGDGTLVNRSTPGIVSGLPAGITAIASGGDHVCARTAAGGAKCWGQNWVGELGDGSYTNRTLPVDVSGLGSGVAALSAGHLHTCALSTVGGVTCWGSNYNAQLGDGTQSSHATPAPVTGLGSGIGAVSAGGKNTCAITVAGGVQCWGYSAPIATPVDTFGFQ